MVVSLSWSRPLDVTKCLTLKLNLFQVVTTGPCSEDNRQFGWLGPRFPQVQIHELCFAMWRFDFLHSDGANELLAPYGFAKFIAIWKAVGDVAKLNFFL